MSRERCLLCNKVESGLGGPALSGVKLASTPVALMLVTHAQGVVQVCVLSRYLWKEDKGVYVQTAI